jgi:hypothetical protein
VLLLVKTTRKQGGHQQRCSSETRVQRVVLSGTRKTAMPAMANQNINSSQKRQYLASGALAIAVRVPYNPCPWCEGPGIAHQEELWHTTLARFDSKWESSQSSA